MFYPKTMTCNLESSVHVLILQELANLFSEKAMAPHSSTLAWKIPWTEEPGGLQFVGSQSRTQLKWLSSSSREYFCLMSALRLKYLCVVPYPVA